MAKQEKTSTRVARTASKTLAKPSASPTVKSVAGSALSQSRTGKATSSKVATRASSVLRDTESGSAARSMAGSVLTQRRDAKTAPSKSSPKPKPSRSAKKAGKKAVKKAVKKEESVAGAALTQHVATRRTADGKPVRVVLTPYRGGSLRRDRVESVVSTVLARHKKK